MMNNPIKDFIAIDPGRCKCGIARFVAGRLAERSVVSPEDLAARLIHEPEKLLVVGDRTGAEQLLNRIFPDGVPSKTQVVLVDENMSSQEGRRRYLMDHRNGWRRFWPIGLQYPKEPYDDYVAIILAERYLANTHAMKFWVKR